MNRFLKFLLFLLLLSSFLLIDFPAVKILISAFIVVQILGAIYARKVRNTLSFKRTVESDRLFIGLVEQLSLEAKNPLPFPIHFIAVSDTADINLAAMRDQYYAFGIKEKSKFTLSYSLIGRKRGRYLVGPTRVHFEDILGNNAFTIELDTVSELVVFPNLHPVVEMHYKSLQPYGAIRNPLPVYEDPAVITGLREYQMGDEIKRVNWKVSARQNKLFVNTYQPSISSDAIVILNLKLSDYAFRNREYYMEQTIEITASMIRRFFFDKQKFGLISALILENQEKIVKSPFNSAEINFTGLLEKLALTDFPQKTDLSDLLQPEKLNLPWGINLYIITPSLNEKSLLHLIRLRRLGHRIYLINTGPELNRSLSLWNIGFASYFAVFEGNILNLKRF